jgi:putative transposase
MATNPHRKRCKAIDEPGHAHAQTFSCFKRRRFLNGDKARNWTAESLRSACDAHRFHLWAYVFMPEHVHILVWPTEPIYSTSDFLKTLKLSVTQKAVAHVRRVAPSFLARMTDQRPDGAVAYRFWQRGRGYDRSLWEPAAIWSTIRYIHANPVRRGLVERPEDWMWSSASYYLTGRPGPIAIDSHSLPAEEEP